MYCKEMHNVIYFLLRHTNFLVLIVLEVICGLLIVSYNDYPRSSFFSTANIVSGTVDKGLAAVSHYIDLPADNRRLLAQNQRLMAELEQSRRVVEFISDTIVLERVDSMMLRSYPDWRFHTAYVVNGTINKSRNMFTIDKGSTNGIATDMVVVNGDGVVGLVAAVSRNFALVLPIINTSSHISVKLKNSNHRGQLNWDGLLPTVAQMVDVPEHAVVEIGDTVVTSGSSSYFPEGLIVGTVGAIEIDKNGGFYNLGVDLAVDYNSIYSVEIIENMKQGEREELEKTFN